MKLNLDYQTVEVDLGTAGRFTVKAKPLSTEAYQAVLDLLGAEVVEALGQGADPARFQALFLGRLRDAAFRETAQAVLGGHVTDIRGITITEDGAERPCTVDDLCHSGALAGPALRLMMQLLALSTLSADDEGNSARPPASTSPKDASGGPTREPGGAPSATG